MPLPVTILGQTFSYDDKARITLDKGGTITGNIVGVNDSLYPLNPLISLCNKKGVDPVRLSRIKKIVKLSS